MEIAFLICWLPKNGVSPVYATTWPTSAFHLFHVENVYFELEIACITRRQKKEVH
jgi:hypothetical protein